MSFRRHKLIIKPAKKKKTAEYLEMSDCFGQGIQTAPDSKTILCKNGPQDETCEQLLLPKKKMNKKKSLKFLNSV